MTSGPAHSVIHNNAQRKKEQIMKAKRILCPVDFSETSDVEGILKPVAEAPVEEAPPRKPEDMTGIKKAKLDEQAASLPERPRNPHKFEEEEWSARVRRMVNPNTDGQSDISGPLVVYSNLLLKQLPLPDGRTLGLGN